MASIGLNLPGYVNDIWYNYGFNEALRRVTIQQRGADTTNALNYYSAIISTLQAINGQSVPAVPAFGAAATQDWACSIANVPTLGVVGKISDWAVGKASINVAAVSTISLWAVGKASIPSLVSVAAAT
jgi:hypothetical protein